MIVMFYLLPHLFDQVISFVVLFSINKSCVALKSERGPMRTLICSSTHNDEPFKYLTNAVKQEKHLNPNNNAPFAISERARSSAEGNINSALGRILSQFVPRWLVFKEARSRN